MASSQGAAGFPLNNSLYDVIAVMHKKSQALEAYDRYLADAKNDADLQQALMEIKADEQKHINRLRAQLPRLLGSAASEVDIHSRQDMD
jgi:hypothetical protein